MKAKMEPNNTDLMNPLSQIWVPGGIFSFFLTISYSNSQISMVKLPSIPIIPASKSVPQSNVKFGPSINR